MSASHWLSDKELMTAPLKHLRIHGISGGVPGNLVTLVTVSRVTTTTTTMMTTMMMMIDNDADDDDDDDGRRRMRYEL